LLEQTSVHQTSVAAQRRYVRPLNTRRFSNPAADLISVGYTVYYCEEEKTSIEV